MIVQHWIRSTLVGMGILGCMGILPDYDDTSAARAADSIGQSVDYFPDTIGTRWQYRGQISEGPLQTIENKYFSNVSSVTGTRTLKGGPTVSVFHDTNPGNHGPSDSFYRRDAAGIVYYGSEPGTPLEKQLVPYQIIRFPMTLSQSFQQFNRADIDFGSDIDGDGTNEHVDVEGHSTVLGQESITVPAGTYADAIRVEARMTLRIRLSSIDRTAVGTDVMTAWFAKGVGLVKYIERQELAALKDDRGNITDITEELEAVEVKSAPTLQGRSESAPQGLFADDTRGHELFQVLFSTGLRAHPR
ncbi:MAG: hypothetical protein H0V35_14250 [Nitrospira sp.]|nr:hypothetical protein [Nitrospira sp.]MBA3754265.1 hypothetical protein [Nitrospira sp.]